MRRSSFCGVRHVALAGRHAAGSFHSKCEPASPVGRNDLSVTDGGNKLNARCDGHWRIPCSVYGQVKFHGDGFNSDAPILLVRRLILPEIAQTLHDLLQRRRNIDGFAWGYGRRIAAGHEERREDESGVDTHHNPLFHDFTTPCDNAKNCCRAPLVE